MFNFELIFLGQGLEPNVGRLRDFDTLIRKTTSLIIEYRNLIKEEMTKKNA